MREQNVDSKVKQAKQLFPWLAIAVVIIGELMLAKYVLQHNENAALLWEPYLMFAGLVAFVFAAGFLFYKKK